VADAEGTPMKDIEHLNEKTGSHYQIYKTTAHDIAGASGLRRATLNELPQLINRISVIMRRVGPRPLSVRDATKTQWRSHRMSAAHVRAGLDLSSGNFWPQQPFVEQ
jgi:lipopolysaccharide/colanic/teichoic acid biosynthesis glycosyltransferase